MITCAKCGSRVGVTGPCRTCAKAAKNPKAMTRAEALAEAQRRWGPKAWVSSHKAKKSHTPRHFEVGASPFNLSIMGSGDSWEAAFADADRRAAR